MQRKVKCGQMVFAYALFWFLCLLQTKPAKCLYIHRVSIPANMQTVGFPELCVILSIYPLGPIISMHNALTRFKSKEQYSS